MAKAKRKEEEKLQLKLAKKAKKKALGPTLEEVETRKSLKPMTKEDWDKQQSVIRKVYDPDTGRTRLIKGDGEVLEEIVTYNRHKEINKVATEGDGSSFQVALKKHV